MEKFYKNDSVFSVKGYDIYFTRYADAILAVNLQRIKKQLNGVLRSFRITKSEILLPGGNKHVITKKLETALNGKGWKKKAIPDEHLVMQKTMVSQTHEIDHFCENSKGNMAIEIEWNNKNPFYDRDLENFRKLHLIGAISLGVIITRAESLHEMIPTIYNNA